MFKIQLFILHSNFLLIDPITGYLGVHSLFWVKTNLFAPKFRQYVIIHLIATYQLINDLIFSYCILHCPIGYNIFWVPFWLFWAVQLYRHMPAMIAFYSCFRFLFFFAIFSISLWQVNRLLNLWYWYGFILAFSWRY